jgi:polyhydroxyalkanoate synthase subunit PhaC
VREYLLGEPEPLFDLLFWNKDTTRLPFTMHSEYLRGLLLNNDLAAGRYVANGRVISLSNIKVPLFVVGTTKDHVAPWKSVYRIHNLADVDITFLLTSGGHNAGIVSPPTHLKRTYQVAERLENSPYRDPDLWAASTPVQKGSWWREWQTFLASHSSGQCLPPQIGSQEFKPLYNAPGTYVFQK